MSTLERVFEVNLIGFGRWIELISNFSRVAHFFSGKWFFFFAKKWGKRSLSEYLTNQLVASPWFKLCLKGKVNLYWGGPLERIPPADEDAGTSCAPLQHPLKDLLSFLFWSDHFRPLDIWLILFSFLGGWRQFRFFPSAKSALSTSADRLLIRPVHHCLTAKEAYQTNYSPPPPLRFVSGPPKVISDNINR